jgi:hypothetical protein
MNKIKSYIFSLALILLIANTSYAQYGNKLESGWYNATVKYSTTSTPTESTYTLKVKVEHDQVTEIDFGNGGSVHDGYNNSGYFYNGGRLDFQNDYEGNIIGATTRVTIQGDINYRYYDITIK